MEWTIKQTAQHTGLSADTLRYYDKEGLASPKRHQNGYRYYDDADITSLKNIAVMKYAHFSLAEIKGMEELFRQEPSAECNAIGRRVMTAKIAALNQSIGNYQNIVSLMEELLTMVDSADAYRCNKEKINGFIGQIFEDIAPAAKSRRNLLASGTLNRIERNEVL